VGTGRGFEGSCLLDEALGHHLPGVGVGVSKRVRWVGEWFKCNQRSEISPILRKHGKGGEWRVGRGAVEGAWAETHWSFSAFSEIADTSG